MEYGSEAEMSYGDYGSDFDVNEYGDYGSDFDVNEYGEYGSDYVSDYGSQEDAGTVDEWESLEYVSEDEYANTFAQVQTSESSESGDETSECTTNDSSCSDESTTTNGLAQVQSSDDDWVLSDKEWLEALKSLKEFCGAPIDEDDEDWYECMCYFVSGYIDLDDERIQHNNPCLVGH